MIDSTKLEGTYKKTELALICDSQNDYPLTQRIVHVLQILDGLLQHGWHLMTDCHSLLLIVITISTSLGSSLLLSAS